MRRTLPTLGAGLVLAACAATAGEEGAMAGAGDAVNAQLASAAMRDASGTELGTLTLEESAEGIAVSGTLTDLPPGTHGFHIHETGSCEPTFEAAGGHWNPTGNQHGFENPEGPHLGDMPNITVGADGTVAVSETTPGGSIRGENPLLDADGAAVMIHAGADDYRTDPSGGSGDRIACGVISAS